MATYVPVKDNFFKNHQVYRVSTLNIEQDKNLEHRVPNDNEVVINLYKALNYNRHYHNRYLIMTIARSVYFYNNELLSVPRWYFG